MALDPLNSSNLEQLAFNGLRDGIEMTRTKKEKKGGE